MDETKQVTGVLTRASAKTESIAFTTLMIIGLGGLLAMALSTGNAVARGCGGGSVSKPKAPVCSDFTQEEYDSCFNQQALNNCKKYDFDGDGYVRGQDNKLFKDKIESCKPKVTFSSGTTQQFNLPEGNDSSVLGAFKVVVENEPVTFTESEWELLLQSETANISDITNLRLYNGAGVILAGPTDPVQTGSNPQVPYIGTVYSTDTFMLGVGSHLLTLQGDLSNDFTNGDELHTQVYPPRLTVVRTRDGEELIAAPEVVLNQAGILRETSISISTASIPASQTVIAGTNNFEVANIVFDASESAGDVRVTQLKLTHAHMNPSNPNVLSNWSLSQNGNTIPINSMSVSCGGVSCATTGATGVTTLALQAGALTIPKGTSVTVKVKANIGTVGTNGAFRVFCDGTSGCIQAIDSNASLITATYDESAGQTMTIKPGGTLNVSIMSDPEPALVVEGSTIQVGKFTIEPINEGAQVDFIGVSLTNPDGGIIGGVDEVASITLQDSKGGSWTTALVSNYATITTASLGIGQNESRSFTLLATFNEINAGSPAESGAGLRFEIGNVDARGETSDGPLPVFGLGQQFNTFTLVKSVPTIANIPFQGTNEIVNGFVRLHMSAVQASTASARGVGLYKLTYLIDYSGIDFTEFKLYEGTSEGALTNLIAAPEDIETSFSLDTSLLKVEVYFDVNNDNTTAPAKEHRIIGAGETKYYTLIGIVNNHDTIPGNEYAYTQLMYNLNTTFAGNAHLNASEVDATPYGDFIWTDLHQDLYSVAGAVDYDMFYNGYRVPGLYGAATWKQVVNDGDGGTINF